MIRIKHMRKHPGAKNNMKKTPRGETNMKNNIPGWKKIWKKHPGAEKKHEKTTMLAKSPKWTKSSHIGGRPGGPREAPVSKSMKNWW